MPRVSNRNLIAPKGQNINVISNIKYIYICIAKHDQAVYFKFAEVYSEPFPTSKQDGYLIGRNYFHKKLHLTCLKRF